jgi:hypothetical protein
LAGPCVYGFQALESPSVLLHSLGNKYFLEFGRGKKGFRNPRKFSIARALP